jgi:hypothetical protein
MPRKPKLTCDQCGGPREVYPDGKRRCRPCYNARQKRYYESHETPKRKPDFIGKTASTYGVSREEAERLRSIDACEACGRTQAENGKALAVDHDHETGEVRGVLCDRCNRALGLLGDRLDGVEALYAYARERVARVTS